MDPTNLVMQDLKVIDADTHVIEPYDLWTSRVPRKWRDSVPHVEWNAELRQDVWTMPGRPLMAAAAFAAMAGWNGYPPDRPPTLGDAEPSTWEVGARLQRMDELGIYAQVLYPNIGGFGGGNYVAMADPALRVLCVRAYNDWVTEWASAAPERFVTNCAIPFWDVEASVAELHRCREMGHRGVIFSTHPHHFEQPYIPDPHWNPIWAAAEELGMPINFHIGGGGQGDFGVNYGGNGARVNYAISSATNFLSNAGGIADIVMGGVCARFPELKFVSVESGIGWMPFLLESMDWQWRATGLDRELPERKMPSEYFRQQVYACFWFERESIDFALGSLGEDQILFETDFPHPTSQTPGPASPGVAAHEYIRATLGHLPARSVEKIVRDNAAELYHVEV